MKNMTFIIAVVAGLLICQATAALAAAKVSISSNGKGIYTVKGADFSGVAGAKITIAYDAATLGNPRVTQGGLVSDALMASNTATPGTVTLALVYGGTKGISGSGEVATIAFDQRGSSPGVIQSQSVDLVNASGTRIAAASEVVNATADTTSDSASATAPPAAVVQAPVAQETTGSVPVTQMAAAAQGSAVVASTAGGSGARVLGGGLVVPEEAAAVRSGEEKPQEQPAAESGTPAKAGAESVAATGAETTQPVREAAAKAAGQSSAAASAPAPAVTYQGVLERFRSYQGAKTPGSLIALFDLSAHKEVRQEPAVVLSDGAARAKVFVDLAAPGKAAPSFALENAQLISVNKVGASRWVLEALPAKGASSATVVMLNEGAMTEIPLTVAPPLPKEIKLGSGRTLSEADFRRFLSERGTGAAPRYDLNGDGVRDYLDDYIFTANYIAGEQGQKVRTKEPK
ncbi:MAG TPA: cohesin domain-containing protein [Geomonas sp.]|nr:cohesin domain-containing protein [Geomonas sp.]